MPRAAQVAHAVPLGTPEGSCQHKEWQQSLGLNVYKTWQMEHGLTHMQGWGGHSLFMSLRIMSQDSQVTLGTLHSRAIAGYLTKINTLLVIIN